MTAIWDQFWAVINDSHIPEINKFTYLEVLLQGEAAPVISDHSLTAENYTEDKRNFKKTLWTTRKSDLFTYKNCC